MINQDALIRLTRARTALLIDQPFFGTLSMRLKLVEDDSIPTLCVNGKTVQYNAAFINSLEHDLVKSALAHEVMHCILNHVGVNSRGAGFDRMKWNWAADYAVNGILKKAGFTLGDGWLYDVQYDDKSAEHIYNLIPTPPPSPQKAPSKGTPGPIDGLEDGTSDPAVQSEQDAEWKVAAVQAANAAKAVGKLSAGIEQFIEEMKQSKVDWKATLRRFISQVSKDDYSWQRPSRKMLSAGFYLPGLYSETMGHVVIASDESGSIDPELMTAFSTEIRAIQEDLRPEKITLMHFDTEVRKTETFGPNDPFIMKRFANGGTDFCPAIEAAVNLPDRPVCMIYLTDLYGGFPETAPDFPVLWITINKLKAPFGETLHIEV